MSAKAVTDRIMAAMAAFAIAAIAAGVAYWLLSGFFGGAADMDALHVTSRRASRGVGFLGLLGFVSAAAALLFAFIGVATLVKRSDPKELATEDDPSYWNSFPAPKD